MKPKAITLAVSEVGVLCLMLFGVDLLWTDALHTNWLDIAAHAAEAVALSFCYALSLYYNDLYNLRIARSFGEFLSRLPYALGISSVLIVIFYKCFPPAAWDGRPLFSTLLCTLLVAVLLFLLRWAFYTLLKSRLFVEHVLILGISPLAWKIAKEIESASHLGYHIVGFVDDRNMVPGRVSLQPSYPMLGPLDHLANIIEKLEPDRIIVALSERRGRLPVRDLLSARMAGVMIEDGIEVHERLTGKIAIESLTPSYLIFSRDFEESKWQTALRRAVSLVVAAIGLIFAAPLMAIVALAIKLDSKGPVFFLQDRAGFDGRIFRLVKFRTMRPVSSEEGTGSVWSRDVTARITRVGKWLRKLRLDELPQFINILNGDMDLVGPRPEMACNIKTMIDQIPYYSLRMAVRPGMTGWAQVKYGYAVSQEDVTEKMRYDLYYVKHMSLWFDLRILIDTVKTVLFGRGSEESVSVTAESAPENVSGLNGSGVTTKQSLHRVEAPD